MDAVISPVPVQLHGGLAVEVLGGGESSRVIAWTIPTQARVGDVEQAWATFAAVDDRFATRGEIRNAAAMIHLADLKPAGARQELDALACRDLGDERPRRHAGPPHQIRTLHRLSPSELRELRLLSSGRARA